MRKAAAIARSGDLYLSRYADCIFWMSRYVERAENLACLLDVTQTFSPVSQGAQNWQSMLALYDDEDAFAARYLKLTPTNVIRFYVSDDSHESSLVACLHLARVNASQLRAIISTEMWVQLNRTYNHVRGLGQRPLEPRDLSHVLSDIRKQCQMLAGITDGGLYRDQGWYFYLLGKHLERADQTTRLLDIKYHLLLPSPDDVGSVIDASQWFALLRAVSGYHAFRREFPYAITPATVAGFLLLDARFPRSVVSCIAASNATFEQLHQQFGLARAAELMDLNHRLITQLNQSDIEAVIASGLHEYLDRIQLHISDMAARIGDAFF